MASQEPVVSLVIPRKRLMLDFDDEDPLPIHPTAEEVLDREITELITQRDTLLSTFRPVASAYRRSRRELTSLKLKLGEKLHAMKSELATKGRAGRWADYLRKWNNFPRTSADRYIGNYQAHQNLIELMKRPSGAIFASSQPVQSRDEAQSEADNVTRDIAKNTLREVSLRMLPEQREIFQAAVVKLAEHFQTKTVAETVFRAVMHCLQQVQQ